MKSLAAWTIGFAIVLMCLSPNPAAAQHAQFYVLDAFGGVHAGGGAPIVSPATPYFGFDVAIDMEVVPSDGVASLADGILVLDKFGGVHKGGPLVADPPVGGTPYFGFDAARAIVYRDSTVVYSGSVDSTGVLITGWSRGAVSAAKLATGKYSVTFARPILRCNYVVALGEQPSLLFATSYDGIAGEISAYRTSSNNQQLIVVTRTSAGALADKSFHVMVHC